MGWIVLNMGNNVQSVVKMAINRRLWTILLIKKTKFPYNREVDV